MDNRLKRSIVIVFVVFYTLVASSANGAEVLGKKPGHVWGGPSSVPNDQAITKRIWAPGIDDGYVPQGVTWANGAVYVSGYRSTDPKVDKGPCRIYKVDAETGNTLGQFDLPEDCGHAGGLAARSIPIPVEAQGAAFDKEGNLWVSASSSRFGTLYKIDSKSGNSVSSHEMVIGIEDLAFDDEGRRKAICIGIKREC